MPLFSLHSPPPVRRSFRIDRGKTVGQDREGSGMFTAMACATVALVVLIERRRQGFSGSPVGAVSRTREGSRVAYYLPLAVLVALGVVMDRIPW
jgi:hypothetical protein